MNSHLHRLNRYMSKDDRIRAKTHGRCAYCGIKLKRRESTRDHMIPRSHGGQDTIENLWLCCRQCNKNKANMSLERFRTIFFGDDRQFEFERQRNE